MAQIREPHGIGQETTAIKPYCLILGDCVEALSGMEPKSVNCVITSPPYWRQREYDVEPELERFLVGNEPTPEEYAERPLRVL